MINPINISTNPICYKKTPVNQTSNPQVLLQDNFELSNYKSAQAILVRNNISFKNLAMPIEITDKYNKKIEGMEHLDLPNIHVFEYPDTNLQLIVDKTNLVEDSQINFSIINTNVTTNPLYDRLIYQLLKTSINKINPDVNLTGDGGQISYNTKLKKGVIPQINYILFSMNYNERDLKNAKKDIVAYYNSPQYKRRNANIQYLYPKDVLYDTETFEKILNAISLDDLKKYNKNFLKNSYAEITAIMNDKDYNNNAFWREFNSNISLKMNKDNKFIDIDKNSPTNKIIQIDNRNDIDADVELDYSYFVENEKECVIANMISDIILTSDMFKSKNYYSSANGYYNDPLNLKYNNNLKHNNLYYKFEFYGKNLNDKKLTQEFQDNLQTIYNSNLDNQIDQWKDVYKDDFLYEYNTYRDNKRLSFISKYRNDIFNIYEIIDSITQDDVKKHMERYLINQEPIVHIKKEK